MRVHLASDAIDADWLGDILEAPLTEGFEHERRIAANMVEQYAADADRVRLRGLLDTRGEIDTVTDQIVATRNHIKKSLYLPESRALPK